MKSMSVVIPTFHSKDLAIISVKSFEFFKPKSLAINYFIVENSPDTSYKNDVVALAESVTWINNDTTARGSFANAIGLEVGLKPVVDEWVFLAHCDVCVVSSSFFDEIFKKAEDGYEVIGTEFDPATHRINALHISGIFLKTAIAKMINYYPRVLDDGRSMDVGDGITLYCRNLKIRHFCFDNTFNYSEIKNKIDKKYDLQVDRCINNRNEVIFMHLGRGIPKTEKTYNAPNKTSLDKWVNFCNGAILC